MSKFYYDGSSVNIFDDKDIIITDRLNIGVYSVEVDKSQNIYLKIVDDFKFPENFKIFGNLYTNSSKVLTSFKERTCNTGVLFSGKSGTGKSLCVKYIATKILEEENLPILLINRQIDSIKFGAFLKLLNTSCCVVIDEFEKLYSAAIEEDDDDKRPQTGFLSILDGVNKNNFKVLFLLTCNNSRMISRYLLNRPGRIYYHFKYKSLDSSIIKEFVNEKLINKEFAEDFRKIENLSCITFDILSALVEESNRFNISPFDAVKYLNINFDADRSINNAIIILEDLNTGNIWRVKKPYFDVLRDSFISFDEDELVTCKSSNKEDKSVDFRLDPITDLVSIEKNTYIFKIGGRFKMTVYFNNSEFNWEELL